MSEIFSDSLLLWVGGAKGGGQEGRRRGESGVWGEDILGVDSIRLPRLSIVSTGGSELKCCGRGDWCGAVGRADEPFLPVSSGGSLRSHVPAVGLIGVV